MQWLKCLDGKRQKPDRETAVANIGDSELKELNKSSTL